MCSVRHLSLRDPAGKLFDSNTDLIRIVKPEFASDYVSLLESAWIHELMQRGDVVKTQIVTESEFNCIAVEGSDFDSVDNALYLRHDRLPFVSFPTEWPLEMLCAAAELTLNLCLATLQHGYGLKDATPYNVIFKGPSPVFVDFLSFERRSPTNITWLPFAQFIRSFLLPALMDSRCAVPCHSIYLSRRDGIEPEEVFNILGPFMRLLPPFLGSVSIPVLLNSFANKKGDTLYRPKAAKSAEVARFVLDSIYNRLRKSQKNAGNRKKRQGVWSSYVNTCTYDNETFAQKSSIVERWLLQIVPKRVLDVGCNTGHFSFIASKTGASVIAIDSDPFVIGNVWSAAHEMKADILPLVVNLARPTPAFGWRNTENRSFLERAVGHFDTVMMLAVVHHMLVTEGIPLGEIIALTAELASEYLIVEFVGPDDPQFKRIARGRDDLYCGYSRVSFEGEAQQHFDIIEYVKVEKCNRWLYLMRKRN